MSRARFVGASAAAAGLAWAAPDPATAWDTLRAAGTAADPTAPLLAAVTLTAQLLLGWLALTAALCLLERLPGAGGRAAALLAGRVAPAALRRVVAVGLGCAVATAPAVPALALGPPAQAAASSPASLDWPVADVGELDWPTTPAPPGPPPAAVPKPVPEPEPAPAPEPSAVRGAPVARAVPAGEVPAGEVVVRPGDTLWQLARSSLQQSSEAAPGTAEVAAAWPSWWAANRDVIGDDPDLLLPGTVLRPPTGAAPPA